MSEMWNEVSEHESFPRGTFDYLFECELYLTCYCRKNGCFGFDIDQFDRISSKAKELLLIGINLIQHGHPDPYFYFTLDFETLKRTNSVGSTSDLEIAELLLIKSLLIRFRTGNLEEFFCITSSLCSSEMKNKIYAEIEKAFGTEEIQKIFAPPDDAIIHTVTTTII